jgi:hypothetical protein
MDIEITERAAEPINNRIIDGDVDGFGGIGQRDIKGVDGIVVSVGGSRAMKVNGGHCLIEVVIDNHGQEIINKIRRPGDN